MADQDNDATPLMAPSVYLRFLPACFAEADAAGNSPFVASYLKIFEKLISGIDDGDELVAADKKFDPLIAYGAGIRALLAANVIGNLFYPRWSFLFAGGHSADAAATFTPPLSEADSKDKTTLFNELAGYFGLQRYAEAPGKLSPVEMWVRGFFEWLGSTIGLATDKNWSIDASREIIAKTPAFDRARGTPMGTEWLINAYLAASPALADGVAVTKVALDNCVRPALIVRDTDSSEHSPFYLFDAYPDQKAAVIISDDVRPAMTRSGVSYTVDDSKIEAYVPLRFELTITLSVPVATQANDLRAAVQHYCRVIEAALEVAKPALTTYAVQIVTEAKTT